MDIVDFVAPSASSLGVDPFSSQYSSPDAGSQTPDLGVAESSM